MAERRALVGKFPKTSHEIRWALLRRMVRYDLSPAPQRVRRVISAERI